MDYAAVDLHEEEGSAAHGRKTRMISFRLDCAQYEALKRMYREHGARSVSEFTREAIERLIANQPQASPSEEFATRFEALEGRVEFLADEVARLLRAAESLRGRNGA